MAKSYVRFNVSNNIKLFEKILEKCAQENMKIKEAYYDVDVEMREIKFCIVFETKDRKEKGRNNEGEM